MELHALRHSSTNILAIGFEGDKRGSLHVQFHDGKGNATALGYYSDVPRAIYNALAEDRKPGKFLNEQLKNKFEWFGKAEAVEILEAPAKPVPAKKQRAITPRDRAAEFAKHRRADVGEFVKTETLPDGYTLVTFERASYYTASDHSISRAVYLSGSNYERPTLKRGK